MSATPTYKRRGEGRVVAGEQKNKRRSGAEVSKVVWKDRWTAYRYQHRDAITESLSRLRRRPISSLLTALVLTVAILLPALAYIAFTNLFVISAGWQQQVSLSVFLEEDLSVSEGEVLSQKVEGWLEVSQVNYLSKSHALEEFKQISGFGDVLAGLEDNPLPHVLLVFPAVDVEVREIAQRLQQLSGVDQVVVDQEWIERLQQLLILAERIMWILALFLALAVMLVIGNTIRLAVENRRDEIKIVKMVGATPAYVRRPFLYTGIWYGALGGVLALIIVQSLLIWLQHPIEELVSSYQDNFQLPWLGPLESLILLLISLCLGWLGAWIAVSQQLKYIEP